MRRTGLLLVFAFSCCFQSQLPAQIWTQTSAPTTNWSCVASSADGSKLVAAVNFGFTNFGLIYISTNSGTTWTATSALVENWAAAASSADGTHLAVTTEYGLRGMYFSTNSGTSWESMAGGSSVATSADGRTVVTCGGTYLFISADSGAAWSIGPPVVAVGEAFTLVSASADGRTLTYTDTRDDLPPSAIETTPASVWSPHGIAEANALWTAIAMSADGTRIAATGTNAFSNTNWGGFLLSSYNSGATAISNFTTVTNWTSIACSADGIRLVAVAGSGEIYTSLDGGTNWSPVNNAPKVNWSGVASSADGTKLVAVATGGGIYTWQATPTPALKITPSAANLLLSWIVPSRKFVLQQSSDLITPRWTNVLGSPLLNFTNLQNQVTVPAPKGSLFYRLASQ